ncbi:hypothetical protein KQI63_05235 [bacterium]|nr:hypothetical protein [bacterium]
MKVYPMLGTTLLCGLSLLLCLGCSGDDGVTSVHPEGEVVAAVVGEWDCVQQVEGEFEVDIELDDLFLNSQGFGSFVMTDGSDGNLEWACQDGQINFAGFPFANSMTYSLFFEERLTLHADRDTLDLTFIFLRME